MQFNSNFRSISIQEPHPIIYAKNIHDPYRMTHNELREIILKETLRLEELKRLYEKEQQILNYGKGRRIEYDSVAIENSRKESFVKDHSFGYSPVKMLNTARDYPSVIKNGGLSNQKLLLSGTKNTAKDTLSTKYQYDEPGSSLVTHSHEKVLNSPKINRQDIQTQRLKTIEKRLANVQKTLNKHPKIPFSDKSTLAHQKDHHEQNLSLKEIKTPKKSQQNQTRRKIVYDSPQKPLQNLKQSKAGQTNDSIIAQINIDSKNLPKSIKTASKHKLKTKSKSTVFIRPKSHTSLKLKLIEKEPATLESKINQKIQNRFKLVSCVFKDINWRNDKNEKDFLMNRFQIESKGRKDIKNIINADDFVLKRHKMVVD